MKPEAIICDMDGTLSDPTHRRHWLEQKNWEEFYSLCNLDPVHSHISKIIQSMHFKYQIIIVTGRPLAHAEATHSWLFENGIPWDDFACRKDGDFRQDYIVKEEILNEYILPRYNPIFALDDRKQVVDMWRRRGIPCLQVAEGDF